RADVQSSPPRGANLRRSLPRANFSKKWALPTFLLLKWRVMQDDEKQLEIEGVVQPVLRDHGMTLVDLEWRPRRPRGVLRLFVDKPGGEGIEDCQRLSREVGDVLDADVPWSKRSQDR